MRIAINGRFLSQPVTGVQRVCREFVAALDQLIGAGEFPNVSARLFIPAAARFRAPDYQSVELVRMGNLNGYAWEQIELPKAAGADILLSLANLAPVSSLIARGRSNVVMVHDLSYRYFPAAYSLPFRAIYSLIMPVIMRNAGCVVTVSESERTAILQHFSAVPGLPDRLIAAPNGAAPVPAPSPSARENFGLYVGTFSQRKNIGGVIEAAIRLARKRGMRFVFVGGTSAAFADRQIAIPPDVAGQLEFKGQINDDAIIADLYRRAAVFLFPSFYESSGLPATEAMAFGCPTVLSRIPALVERCGDAAEYCDPKDIDSIVAAAERILDDPARAAALSHAGRMRAAQFSWERQVREVVAAVQSLGVNTQVFSRQGE